MDLYDALEGNYNGASVRLKGGTEKQGKTSGTEDLKLLQLVNNVARQLPKSLSHEYYILIDDLDLHWSGSDVQKAFLGAMFLSIWDLSKSPKVKFVVSIRKTIYQKIHLEERDKFSDLIETVHWRKVDVKRMVQRRLSFVLNSNESQIWDGMFPNNSFDDFMWKYTDGMPREVIRLAVNCVKVATSNGNKFVTDEDLTKGLHSFSEDRIDDLGSEYLHQYPALSTVIRKFRGGKKEFNLERVQEVGLIISEITANSEKPTNYAWASSGFEHPLPFARILLEVGFLLLKEHHKAPPRAPIADELDLIDSKSWFAIKPKYWPALDLK